MQVFERRQLKNYNTFSVEAMVDFWVDIENARDIGKVVDSPTLNKQQKFVLGGGSNTLITSDVNGVIIHSKIMGRDIVTETESEVIVEVGSGENWHELVSWVVDQGWAGIENLALIPGNVGGAPVQNLAAYGHNFSDVFVGLEGVDLESGKTVKLTENECEFGYRSSIFKTKLRHKMLIDKVRIKLKKEHALETSYYSIGGRYDSISKEIEAMNVQPPRLKDVFQAVINIRTRKLPDTKKVPSVGSYFINPAITKEKLELLKSEIQDLQYYPVDQLRYVDMNDDVLSQAEMVKVPAGKLLDELGWKGRKIGNCMIYPEWASIVTHNGKASGAEILEFTQNIADDVSKHYDIDLESEVTII